MTTLAGDRYIVISSDGHAGAQMHEYRDYLEAKYLDEFDEWAKSFVNPFDGPAGRDRLPQLGLGAAPRGARGRRRRGRGAVPQHDPAVLPVGQPRWHGQPEPRRVRAAVGRAEGAQPLAGRLLRRHARAPRRHGADLPERRRRRGGGDRVGARARASSAASCCRACRPTRTCRRSIAPDYDPIWAACAGARHAGQQPHAARRAPTPGPTPRRWRSSWSSSAGSRTACSGTWSFGGVFARYPASSWCSPSSRRAGCPAVLDDARPPIQPLPRPEHRGVALRRRAGEAGDELAELLLGTQLLRRCELLPSERGAAALRDRRRPGSCGARTTRTSRARTRTPPKRCATRSPASTPRRSRRWSGCTAVEVYGFDLDVLAPVAGTGRAYGRRSRGAARARFRPTRVRSHSPGRAQALVAGTVHDLVARYGPWALVCGASEGLGGAIADVYRAARSEPRAGRAPPGGARGDRDAVAIGIRR